MRTVSSKQFIAFACINFFTFCTQATRLQPGYWLFLFLSLAIIQKSKRGETVFMNSLLSPGQTVQTHESRWQLKCSKLSSPIMRVVKQLEKVPDSRQSYKQAAWRLRDSLQWKWRCKKLQSQFEFFMVKEVGSLFRCPGIVCPVSGKPAPVNFGRKQVTVDCHARGQTGKTIIDYDGTFE